MIILISITLIFGKSGLAYSLDALPLPLSEEVRAKLGTIAVASASFIPELETRGYTKDRVGGSCIGGGTGLVHCLGAIGQAGDAAVYLVIILIITDLLVPVLVTAIVAGALIGASEANPGETVVKGEAALNKFMGGMQGTMRNHLLRVAADQTSYNYVPLEGVGPVTEGDELNYNTRSSENADTVLEVSVLRFGLTDGVFKVNAPLSLFTEARARLIRVSDNKKLHDITLRCELGKREFSYWTANNAQVFSEKLDHCYQYLSEKFVEELFLLYLPQEQIYDLE